MPAAARDAPTFAAMALLPDADDPGFSHLLLASTAGRAVVFSGLHFPALREGTGAVLSLVIRSCCMC